MYLFVYLLINTNIFLVHVENCNCLLLFWETNGKNRRKNEFHHECVYYRSGFSYSAVDARYWLAVLLFCTNFQANPPSVHAKTPTTLKNPTT